ncbi:hypothetical protein B0T26DRAFT_641623 [Lasiosphaeria miniovina]|uniref:Uncharacterized protein n=1 Tax=Lasiosphaeria miniovina TaxID=1954250 RepID=A0AA40ATC4_9PEZI|nr:uncharacterized protein B0T26DRAFT_641623 [Lasiosphaeria miniovina]KAK0721571.1 hypothetical protein B0T26DRAFT_641623 [Lasiosphaeria miniovina]
MSHGTLECHSPCGHCGAPNPKARPDIQKYADVPWLESYDHPIHNQQPHVASDCPVARQNRCKCVPFPTFHVAARCGIACSRSCGNGAPRGSFQHPNAMLCKSRCCMCGLRGHSGRECRLKKCRCGDAHLGQDCTWNPVCRVPDCDRYLCGMHCRECGSMEKPFLRWRCGRCLGFDGPLQWGDRKDSRRRGKVGLPGGDERAEAPASAPQNQTELAASEATTPPSSLFGGPRQPYKKDGSLDATSNEK